MYGHLVYSLLMFAPAILELNQDLLVIIGILRPKPTHLRLSPQLLHLQYLVVRLLPHLSHMMFAEKNICDCNFIYVESMALNCTNTIPTTNLL